MKFLLEIEIEIEKWGKNVMIYNVVKVLGRYQTRDQTRVVEVWGNSGGG